MDISTKSRRAERGIVDHHLQEVADLCRRTGARRLDVFGSAVRDDFNPMESDLDFLVEFDDKRPSEYANAYFELKDGLEMLFGRPVDLVTRSALQNPFFAERVRAELQNVYAR